jgi:hypothetical protein
LINESGKGKQKEKEKKEKQTKNKKGKRNKTQNNWHVNCPIWYNRGIVGDV